MFKEKNEEKFQLIDQELKILLKQFFRTNPETVVIGL